jgi:hypothetical protein
MALKGGEGDWMARGRCTEDRGRGVVGHDDWGCEEASAGAVKRGGAGSWEV